ncbi:DUF1003 domain-containing protein [Demequina aurantiaca]|uniref:DUF1003 domain-containing protein n=1 Tax=Demequina aurantiaca TaxID=676200 RepID=UPI003D33FF16
MAERLDRPKSDQRRISWRRNNKGSDRFGAFSEGIARFLGTPRFLFYLTMFCIAWIAWNIWAPADLRFDSAARGFTALTLMLSLQASYAAPLILLAQNRQDDRDKVGAEQDRQSAQRSLDDTEYLAREVAALRHAVSDTATRDFVRSELRSLLEELRADDEEARNEASSDRKSHRTDSPKKK